MRKIVLHYHLFKNAGTSVDNILKGSFAGAWQNWDRPIGKNPPIRPSEMAQFISQNPHLKAISSHDMVPPLPVGEFEVFPIVFIRHPVIRARSAYLFEWMKQPGLDKPKGSFKEYLDENLPEKGSSVIANFQVGKLSHIVYGDEAVRKPLQAYEKLDYAKLFLDGIPYFGLVEHFQQSLVRLHYYLKPNFPEVRIVNHQANVTQDPVKQLEESLSAICSELGEQDYQRLCERNDLDMKLYKHASNRFFSVVPPK